jgi:hypothetical protein
LQYSTGGKSKKGETAERRNLGIGLLKFDGGVIIFVFTVMLAGSVYCAPYYS